MILILDNYDSFTYNLVQYLGEKKADLTVIRNDEYNVDNLLALNPTHIVLSPGPCTPDEAGVSMELVQKCPENIPLMGICLGHQSIGQAFGADVIRAPYLMHGKLSSVLHDGQQIYQNIPSPMSATRYHSLVIAPESLPDCLRVTAWTEDGIIMGIQHKSRPIFGIQYHPESIRTPWGKQILHQFLDL